MNGIVQFRLCKLTDKELVEKADKMTDGLYEDGKIPSRHIPARPDHDYDLIIGELLVRFKELTEKKGLPLTKTAEAKLRYLYKIQNLAKDNQEFTGATLDLLEEWSDMFPF